MAEMVKMAMEMPFSLWTWMGPRNHVLDGGRDPPMGRERGARCIVSAVTAELIDLSFGW